MEKDFESGFENFLLSDVYDWGEDVLFRLVRAAYAAGWTDAGGDPPETREEERPFLSLTQFLEAAAAETNRRGLHLEKKDPDKE